MMPSRGGKSCQYSSFKKKFFITLASLGIIGFLLNMHISLSGEEGADDVSCRPRRNIVFLKTHKCAGSSLQNILMRFGEEHRLNFLLPLEGNYLGHPAPFSRTLLPNYRTRSIPYNILAHHTRFDHREISAVMPRGSLYLTVVREPSQLFESAFSYYGLDRLYQSDIHAFISYLPRLEPDMIHKRLKGRYGINQMYFDLGGDGLNNETVVRDYIGRLDGWFDLVLVAERMDESLVLMRHALCWDMDQVVTFKLNARADQFKSNLTDAERSEILRLNRADVLLYLHFHDKLDRQVESFGRDRMASEVAQLRNRTADWYALCVRGEQLHPTGGSTRRHYFNPRVKVFQTRDSNATCGAMTREELEYTDLLRARQVAKYPAVYRVARRPPANRRVYRFRNGTTRDVKTYRDVYNYMQSRRKYGGPKKVSNRSAPGRSVPAKNASNDLNFALSNVSKDLESLRFKNASKSSNSFTPSKNVPRDIENLATFKNSSKFSKSFTPYKNPSEESRSFTQFSDKMEDPNIVIALGNVFDAPKSISSNMSNVPKTKTTSKTFMQLNTPSDVSKNRILSKDFNYRQQG